MENKKDIFLGKIEKKWWAYVLTKSKKEKRAEVSVKTIQGLKDGVGLIRALEGDNEFLVPQIENFVKIMILD